MIVSFKAQSVWSIMLQLIDRNHITGTIQELLFIIRCAGVFNYRLLSNSICFLQLFEECYILIRYGFWFDTLQLHNFGPGSCQWLLDRRFFHNGTFQNTTVHMAHGFFVKQSVIPSTISLLNMKKNTVVDKIQCFCFFSGNGFLNRHKCIEPVK